MMNTYDWWVAKLRAIRHSKPPEPPMRVRLHEAGHAVVGHRFGYVQQGIMLREDDTGETSQQHATGMDDEQERDERISCRAAELRHDRLNRAGRQQGEES